MPRRILIDTVFVIALINQRDQYHEQALEWADRIEGYPLLITHAVLLELGNALARGYRKEASQAIEQFLQAEEVEIMPVTATLFAQAFAMYKRYQDKEWSLVDCVPFVVMREAGITQALTFDEHFMQAGFQALMRELPQR